MWPCTPAPPYMLGTLVCAGCCIRDPFRSYLIVLNFVSSLMVYKSTAQSTYISLRIILAKILPEFRSSHRLRVIVSYMRTLYYAVVCLCLYINCTEILNTHALLISCDILNSHSILCHFGSRQMRPADNIFPYVKCVIFTHHPPAI